MNEQIEEMANELATLMLRDRNLMSVCEKFYNAGYRKPSDGEWGFDGMSWTCSECGEYATKGIKTNFCPNCGAKMKGD
jgi:rubrerythrin